jgi:phosphopentomutase
LYRICEIAREILRGPHEVGRVIARPFTGAPGCFTRTPRRHDFAVPPPRGMLLDRLAEGGVPVAGVGKINDVYLGRGIAKAFPARSNAEGMARTQEALREFEEGLVFTNLVDFDMLYGHRNDVEGYGRALEEFDAWLPGFLGGLGEGDLAILTADHGCDPTTPSTDHSREYTPLLTYGPRARSGVDLGTRPTLADVGQSIASNFQTQLEKGTSFLGLIV